MKREFYKYFIKYVIQNKDLYDDIEIDIYKIIYNTNYILYDYKSSIEGLKFNSFDEEYEYINNLLTQENSRIKQNNYYNDEELQFYIDSYNKGFIRSNDLIKNIYWESIYIKFNELMKQKGLFYMKDLVTFNFNCLYKYKGFNYKIVEYIVETFKEWCNRTLKKNNKENRQLDKEKLQKAINDVIDEFFV